MKVSERVFQFLCYPRGYPLLKRSLVIEGPLEDPIIAVMGENKGTERLSGKAVNKNL